MILARAARAVVKRVRGRVPFFIEAIEQRRMLNSTCHGGAAFTYTGDSNGNVITASTAGGTLTVSDTMISCNFAQSSVTSLTIDGGDGNDTITVDTSVSSSIAVTLQGGNQDDNITGGNSGDTILGGSGNDTIIGGSGNDSIDGGTNDDVIQGDDGVDTLVGGTGVNSLWYDTSTSGINITLDGTVNDTDGFGNTDNIGTQFRHVKGGSGDDFISGDSNDNKLEGGSGTDTLRGSGGAGADGADSLYGGNDAGDLADFSLRTDSIKVTLDVAANDGNQGSSEGDDVRCYFVTTGSGNDTILGDGSANKLLGGSGTDSIVGGDGGDTLDGGAGNDTLSGGLGDDSLVGGADNDNLSGDNGQDTLDGGTGVDAVHGNNDNDTLLCGSTADGADSLYGDGGTDFLDYSLRSANINVTIGDFSSNDGASGELDYVDGSIENVTTGTGADTISGNGSSNVLDGGSGNDRIDGGDASDTLYGRAGNDILSGGAGSDQLFGDTGADSLYGGASGSDDAAPDTLNGGVDNDTDYYESAFSSGDTIQLIP